MALTWPGSLPQSPTLSWSHTLANTTVRTETETGPAKVRRRYTAGVEQFRNVGFHMTAAQKATLQTFFDTTTAGGSLRFDMPAPDDGTLREMRFLEPPIFTPVGLGFRAVLQLEALP